MTDVATSTIAQLLFRRPVPARTGAAHQDRLCRTILARAQARVPADPAIRHEAEPPAPPQRGTAAAPAERPPRERDHPTQANRSRLGRLPPLPPETGPAPADLDRMLRRLERSLAARDAPGARADRARDHRPAIPTGDAPMPGPSQRPLRQGDGTAAARAAVAARFPPIIETPADLPDLPRRGPRLWNQGAGPARPAHMSVPLRLACHAINATVMVLVLPVGAAMMIYALLRGENLNASARMLALMGLAVGLQHSPVGAQILALI